MDEDTYVELFTSLIKRQDTVMRSEISAHERLTATLRYLTSGRNYLRLSTIISPHALSEIIPETCSSIYQVLQQKYMKFHTTETEWKSISEGFEEVCNFPNCVGAVDRKHVQIKPPPGSGEFYYNYKGYNSLVLMSICNVNYEFIMCDFGTNGRISDGGVIACTHFYTKLKNKTLKLPPATCPRNSDRELPFVFVGDGAFALHSDFLKPNSQNDLNHDQKIYDYRLSRARCKIENSFGILSARFQVLQSAISLQIESIDKVVMACCVLHYFLRRKCSQSYTPMDSLDQENRTDGTVQMGLRANPSQLANLQRSHSRNFSSEASQVRREFTQFFNEEGALSWQERMIQ
ncbi:unnamed protein product [Acanthoscelides obtectus]|uniref:DDE Tnp4 domain-containing protein n=1 Tax=Acanthoscelides obtectus TaxID=200917 RepID=A0A9P0JIE5_ACAOB|nr:unnamed protein product [Acanthoscelides obtectus]CAK1661593.1 Putative nuclease HARBI1 [Acanthoscelides obtectus]